MPYCMLRMGFKSNCLLGLLNESVFLGINWRNTCAILAINRLSHLPSWSRSKQIMNNMRNNEAIVCDLRWNQRRGTPFIFTCCCCYYRFNASWVVPSLCGKWRILCICCTYFSMGLESGSELAGIT